MNLRQTIGALLFLFMGISAIAGTPMQSGPLRAGAAKVEITPTADRFPISGGQTYGSAHDPLYARALVLDNGIRKLALISVDETMLPNGDELIGAVTQELGILPEQLILDATHDHNAPLGGPMGQLKDPKLIRYFEQVKQGIVQAAHDANTHLQSARIAFGRGRAYINTNRDEKIGTGFHMGYSPEGPSDKTVAVLTVTTPAGKPIAVYANYAVHGVVMYRAHTADGQVQITGDLPGATSKYVEDRLGKDVVALWTSGAAGDQNPLFMANYNQDAPDVYDEGASGWAILDVQARRLGQEIVRVSQVSQDSADRAVLWGKQSTVTCPGQQRAEPVAPGTPAGGYLAPSNVPMVDAEPVHIPLSLLMVNDIAIAGVSGEVFTQIGEHFKETSLFDRSMMVTVLANGIGYIPTDAAYLLPAEKAVGNRLKPGCAEPAMIAAFRDLMQQYLTIWKGSN